EASRMRSDRIRLLPPSVDPTDHLASSDLLLIHPGRDLDPGAIALGRAFGVPMLLADVPGVDEYVHPGSDALVFDPGDPGALKTRVGQVLDDPECRDRLVSFLRDGVGRPGGPGGMVAS